MRSVNQVTLIGNVTRDPEMRQTVGGQKIVTFGVATNREWNGADGQKKSTAEYHNLVSFGRLAELCTDLLAKGSLVYIQGYLKTRSWDHESGVKVFRTEVVVTDMICFDRRGPRPHPAEPEAVGEGESTEAPPASADSSFDDDDFFADASKEAEKVEAEEK